MVEIDTGPRVVGSSEIEVAAAPALVWTVLTEIEGEHLKAEAKRQDRQA